MRTEAKMRTNKEPHKSLRLCKEFTTLEHLKFQFTTVRKGALLVRPCLESYESSPQHSATISLGYISVLSFHLRLGFSSCLFPSGFPI